jgi:hypothetical protein
MHRAGTSVVARGLQALGVDLGDSLMSADVRQNARGFFEDLDIVKLDDALLDAQRADWKSLAPLDNIDWNGDEHAPACGEARRLLESRLARTGCFGFKDPRVPRLLPFWQRVFADMQVADAYVIAVRHPRAVIDSLTARDGLDPRRSGWLWLTHMVASLRYTQGRPRVVVDYDRLLAAPERELARIAHALGLSAAAPERDDVRVYTSDFLSSDLRHAQYAEGDLSVADMPPGVAEVHLLVQRLARDEADPGAPATTGQIDALFGRLAAASPLLAYAGTVERAADDVPRLSGELAWARSALAAATAYNEDLRAVVKRKDDELVAADVYQKDLAANLARIEGDLVAAHALLERMREGLLGRMLLRIVKRID